MADPEISETCMSVVKCALIFFGIFGSYGNSNIILATYLHKSLRSKCGLLFAFLAFNNLICLIFELLSAVRLISNTAKMPREKCFWSISPYLFIENMHSYMICCVGFDRLIAICFPIKYMLWPTRLYVLAMVTPGVFYASTVVTLGATFLDNPDVPVCNPPLAYPAVISKLWNLATIVVCCTTVCSYVVTYIMLFKIAPRKTTDITVLAQIKIQKIIVKTLTVNVCVYFFSAVLCAFFIFIMRSTKISGSFIAEAETAVIPVGLASFSFDYYVYFWRSSEYRRAFKQQLFCGCLMWKQGRFFALTNATTMLVTQIEPTRIHGPISIAAYK
ncbi:hypothetical protein L596_021577 [Steinernema carpocapsae]|uniref:G-protein coupled receptors family 1 profile domain-containing protein n=1 Tax=Steinernema carpocapsae TaxID=34508 RepID=A0A4U5MJI0_STECR|nr:hypothetical protein L596_021577 [Steinernema carpocapsae]